ncbi:RNA polymerase sigma factor [Actinoplanes subtropicus]|uniref:RNA polymerase sigma factor n=1 Tax=Actinoplanes subtropicus TaxID=543632 RepID=UPI0009FCFF7E|nr:sigma factor [Actinoplanes subtropicus]
MAHPTVLELDGIHIETLAREASAGNRVALNSLLVAVGPETLQRCRRLLANREDAEEACQDTLWAVAVGIGKFHGRPAFRTWLHGLATDRAQSTYQAIRRRYNGEAVGAPMADPADPWHTWLDVLDAVD